MALLPQAPLTSLTTAPDLTSRVAALEARCAALEAVLRIGSAGDVTIKSASTISMEASSSIMCKAGTNLDVVGATNVTIKAFGAMSVTSGLPMTLRGATISLN
jgi:hypothetical protein